MWENSFPLTVFILPIMELLWDAPSCWDFIWQNVKQRRTGQNPDTYTDLVIYAIVVSIICARTYYVIFSWDNYKNDLLSIFNLRQGGIAIYGAVIGAVATVFVYSRVKKLSFTRMLDTACIGLVAGQILGRWGNFFNREAFGGYTDESVCHAASGQCSACA